MTPGVIECIRLPDNPAATTTLIRHGQCHGTGDHQKHE